jgi:hypothetical protein
MDDRKQPWSTGRDARDPIEPGAVVVRQLAMFDAALQVGNHWGRTGSEALFCRERASAILMGVAGSKT